METGMFFKILGFLLVVGTLASLISGVPLPGSPSSTTPVGAIGVNMTAISTTGSIVCYPAYPFGQGGCLNPWGCGGWCEKPPDNTAWFGIPAFIGWVIASILAAVAFGVQIFTFFSGISGFISGTSGFPAPFDFMVLIGLSLAWILLALEVISRVIGVIWGR